MFAVLFSFRHWDVPCKLLLNVKLTQTGQVLCKIGCWRSAPIHGLLQIYVWPLYWWKKGYNHFKQSVYWQAHNNSSSLGLVFKRDTCHRPPYLPAMIRFEAVLLTNSADPFLRSHMHPRCFHRLHYHRNISVLKKKKKECRHLTLCFVLSSITVEHFFLLLQHRLKPSKKKRKRKKIYVHI